MSSRDCRSTRWHWLALVALTASGCMIRYPASSNLAWQKDAFRGVRTLTSAPMENVLFATGAGTSERVSLRTQLASAEGDDAATLTTQILTGPETRYRGLECQTLESALDDAPWPLGDIQTAVSMDTVTFTARIPLAQVAKLEHAHKLQFRSCGQTVEFNDSEWEGARLWAFQDFATVVRQAPR